MHLNTIAKNQILKIFRVLKSKICSNKHSKNLRALFLSKTCSSKILILYLTSIFNYVKLNFINNSLIVDNSNDRIHKIVPIHKFGIFLPEKKIKNTECIQVLHAYLLVLNWNSFYSGKNWRFWIIKGFYYHLIKLRFPNLFILFQIHKRSYNIMKGKLCYIFFSLNFIDFHVLLT